MFGEASATRPTRHMGACQGNAHMAYAHEVRDRLAATRRAGPIVRLQSWRRRGVRVASRPLTGAVDLAEPGFEGGLQADWARSAALAPTPECQWTDVLVLDACTLHSNTRGLPSFLE